MKPSEIRILGLDIGSKRIGLALWDPESRLATPLLARNRKTLKEDLRFFAHLVEEKKIEAFLVGLPIALSGRITESTQNSLFWVEQLKKTYELPVFTYDESLSTRDALLLLQDRPKKEQKEKKDSVSAALVLEEFMRVRGQTEELEAMDP